jgi:flagellar biosynthesis protein FlhF
MKPQRFNGKTIQKVQAQIRAALGEEALIYSIRTHAKGVEILAGLPGDDVEEENELPEVFASVPAHTVTQNSVIENLTAKLRLHEEPTQYKPFQFHHSEPNFSVRSTKTVTKDPVQRYLRKLGFRGKFCLQFASEFNHAWQARGPYTQSDIENSLLSRLSTPRDELYQRKRVCALVGPSGVGKTATVAKLAKQFIYANRTKKVGLITSDYCDIASKNQLSYYSGALNIPLLYANNQKEMTIALHELRHMDFILIDTYGISQRDKYNLGQLRTLLESHQEEITTFITLPCNVQEPILDEVVRAFMTTNVGGCILTRQDESITMAPVLSVCMNYHMPVNYVCSGPNIFGDIEKAEACIMLHHIVNECNVSKRKAEIDLLQNLQRVTKNTNEVSYE